MPAAPDSVSVSFSHLHIFCDALRPLEEYKQLEAKLNAFATAGAGKGGLEAGRAAWLALAEQHGSPERAPADPSQYRSAGQDLVDQLLVGLGWRVTGTHDGGDTRSLVVTSSDPEGVQFVVTALKDRPLEALAATAAAEPAEKKARAEDGASHIDHFSAAHVERFASYHSGRQGIAVLGFQASPGSIEAIQAKYAALHPSLLTPSTPRTYPGAKVLEVFAYYKGEKGVSEADPGTVLRFVELTGEPLPSGAPFWVLPGIQKIEAAFDGISQPAYCDHWVSNVFSRTGFIDTLNETLGFTPKVDFNAGVVAAGEAQIESTVTGNTSTTVVTDKAIALKDQSQIYLPINNALSEVGHVHFFLKELGQGVQHVASRVEDLGSLIQRANDYRKMTGAGLSFLQIPRSYYGYLTKKRLAQSAQISEEVAEQCIAALRQANILDARDIVDLEVTRERVASALPTDTPAHVVDLVLRARYGNLYSLLRDHLSEEAYLRIVRNNILVDIQGEDLLLQIFTSSILQRGDAEEAPFLEFIQRVCSQCLDPATGCPRVIKPGCGGFGIRNFLTLFLSIEVSKAASARAEALEKGDAKTAELEGKRVDAFTQQLDESNPVLTAISDAMTAEAEALEKGDAEAAKQFAAKKAAGQEELKLVSTKFKELMRKLREGNA